MLKPRTLLVCALLWLTMPLALAVAEPSVAPTTAEVLFYTRPLVKARLRLPDSLQDFATTRIAPVADDTSRFDVQVRFKAKTPFGGLTQHSAQFKMRRAASKGVWIVTAE